MRKTKNISKKVIMVILAASMMMTTSISVSVANPVSVYAGDWNENNSGDNDDAVDRNYGTITTNNGTIGENTNRGSVETNNGHIDTNNGNVTGNNAGLGENEEGKGITINNGSVGTNTENGYVGTNNGRIETNGGHVDSNNAGMDAHGNVNANAGINTNNGTVGTNTTLGVINTNNTDGLVTINNGVVFTNNGNEWDNENNAVISGIDTNSDRGSVADNKGLINQNNGFVSNNVGIIKSNNGDEYDNSGATKGVFMNDMSGIIETNNGRITDNYGGVLTNEGIITTNKRYTLLSEENTTHVGNITTNNGKVESNHGKIEENASSPTNADIMRNGENNLWDKGVIKNETDGEIVLNSGAIFDNRGAVDKNTGFIKMSFGTDAVIKVNNGEVDDMYDGSVIELNGVEATVSSLRLTTEITNNFGNVKFTRNQSDSNMGSIVNQYEGIIGYKGSNQNNDYGAVTNYYGGEFLTSKIAVTNNFADVTDQMNEYTHNALTADGVNQFRSVSFVADEHSLATYNDQFTEKTLMNADGTDGDTRYYVNVTGGNGQGTITIIASEGYTLKDNGTLSGSKGGGENDTYAFSYTLTKQKNGSYKLALTGYNGNSCQLSADMFGLVVEAIQNTNNDPVNPQPNPNPVNPTPDPSPNPSPSPAIPNPSSVPTVSKEFLQNTSGVTMSAAQKSNAETSGLTMKLMYLDMNILSESAIVTMIPNIPAGGVVNMPNLSQTGFSAAMVQTLLARGGAEINFYYVINGVVYRMTIPAGYDLASIIEDGGGISFAKLVSVFGSQVVG